jgi:predicted transcriptional regulator
MAASRNIEPYYNLSPDELIEIMQMGLTYSAFKVLFHLKINDLTDSLAIDTYGIARCFGLDARSVQRALNELHQKGLIERSSPIARKNGQVYIVRADKTDTYKIGVSTQFNQRLKVLSKECGQRLKPVVLIDSNNIYELEVCLHKMFAHKRLHGEWFSLEPHDIKAIQEYCDRSAEVPS